MSADNYAGMTTERLLELFVAAAKRFGGGRRLFNMMNDMRASKPPGTPQQTPEQVKAADDVRALGAMLRKRISIPQARRLMEDDDPDVRTCAAGQFGSMDQEWAIRLERARRRPADPRSARRQGAARRPPPARPTLKEMSDDALLGRFEDAATRLSATRFLDCIDEPADQEAKNRLICEGTDILSKSRLAACSIGWFRCSTAPTTLFAFAPRRAACASPSRRRSPRSRPSPPRRTSTTAFMRATR